MIAWTIYITFGGAVLLLFLPRAFSRWIALLITTATFAISLATFFCHDLDLAHFTTIVRVPWVPALGMNYHLAVDGISLTLVLVTSITAVSSVLFSWDIANPASGGQLLPSGNNSPHESASRSSWATEPVDAIRQLMASPEKPKREIGFHVREQAPRYRTRN